MVNVPNSWPGGIAGGLIFGTENPLTMSMSRSFIVAFVGGSSCASFGIGAETGSAATACTKVSAGGSDSFGASTRKAEGAEVATCIGSAT
jgi:hypothetical protein